MSHDVPAREAAFAPGEVVHHLRFEYRGVIVDVDPVFMGTDAWYEQMARSRPRKDAPWYHVLVDGASHRTYVAERHLRRADPSQPVAHPETGDFFAGFDGSRYVLRRVAD